MIAGGGTGGHVFPGLAVARELRRTDSSRPLLWIGARAGLESRLVPREGIPLLALGLGGMAGKSLPARLRGALMAAAGVARCAARFLFDRPAAVLGVGGYASGPAGLAAALLRVPLVLHEQNAIPGATNRALARFSRLVAVSFEETRPLLRARRVEVTGNPVRSQFFGAAPPEDPSRLHVLIVGGSRGARSINRAVSEALPKMAAWRDRLAIVHQTGEAEVDRVRRAHEAAGFASDVRPFLDDLPERMLRADLVIGRAGASAVFELAASGRASVLVPFPHAAGGHQSANARRLAEAGAAEVIEDGDLTAERLVSVLDPLLSDRQRLRRMGEAARALARPDAARRIAAFVESAAGGREAA